MNDNFDKKFDVIWVLMKVWFGVVFVAVLAVFIFVGITIAKFINNPEAMAKKYGKAGNVFLQNLTNNNIEK